MSTLIPTAYKIIYPTGVVETKFIDWPRAPKYEQIRDLVQPLVGDPMEHVSVLRPEFKGTADQIQASDAMDMFVDELGHLRNPKPKFNPKATIIYLHLSRVRGQDYYHEIVGTAVLFARRIWF